MISINNEQTEGIKIPCRNHEQVHITSPKKTKEDITSEIIMEEDITEEDITGEDITEENITDKTIVVCSNNQVEISGLTSGVIVKVPVILAALTVQVNLNSLIELSDPIFEIKKINKTVKLIQCKLIQDTDMLFIKGVLIKDIEFYSSPCTNNAELSRDVHYLSVGVPFKCTTPVHYNGTKPANIVKSVLKEFTYCKNNSFSEIDTTEDEKIMYESIFETNQIVTEYYNEPPYCEFISSKIVENDKFIEMNDLRNSNVFTKENFFIAIEGNGVLYLTLRILQNQQVAISNLIEELGYYKRE